MLRHPERGKNKTEKKEEENAWVPLDSSIFTPSYIHLLSFQIFTKRKYIGYNSFPRSLPSFSFPPHPQYEFSFLKKTGQKKKEGWKKKTSQLEERYHPRYWFTSDIL